MKACGTDRDYSWLGLVAPVGYGSSRVMVWVLDDVLKGRTRVFAFVRPPAGFEKDHRQQQQQHFFVLFLPCALHLVSFSRRMEGLKDADAA